jgi:Fe-S cluster biogenesis protein NfuA
MPVEDEPASGPVCPTPAGFEDLSRQARNLQTLIDETQKLPDPTARALLEKCLQSVLSFYGDGLARMLEIVAGFGPSGEDLLERLVNDPGVKGLLLIHGLHPVDLATRLQEALEKVRPYLESHGGNVELLGLEDGFARLRLRGACKTCPSSSVTLELAVRKALEEACPDLLGFNVE